MTNKWQRQTGWGEGLYLEININKGGLNPHVDRIRKVVGPTVGVRNSFAKLYRLEDPPTDPTDRWRAWLLLTAVGEPTADWGVGDDAVPPAIDLRRLSEQVVQSLRCSSEAMLVAPVAA